MLFEEVFRHLNKAKVDYIVVGGVALVLHGVVRLTADLDLMIYLEEKNIRKFVKTIQNLGFRPRVPMKSEDIVDPLVRQRLRQEKNMKVFSFYHPKEAISLVDVLIDEPLDYQKIKAHVEKMKVGKLLVPVISSDDLIALKKISGRPQDLADIESLRQIKKHEKE
ncbi:MAG: DUF6036 family nucleotidyltransferase [Planctomycetota bacterium]|jgi:hypothetical protein